MSLGKYFKVFDIGVQNIVNRKTAEALFAKAKG